MLSEQQVISVMQECLDGLARSDILESKINLTEDTVLLGNGAVLDSVGFVTFISDMEERLSSKCAKDVYFVLDDIQEFNINQPYLAVSTMARYAKKLVSDKESK